MGRQKVKPQTAEEIAAQQEKEQAQKDANNNNGNVTIQAAKIDSKEDLRIQWDNMEETDRNMGENCGRIVARFTVDDEDIYKSGTGTIIQKKDEDDDEVYTILTAASLFGVKNAGGDIVMATEAYFYWKQNGTDSVAAQQQQFGLDLDSILQDFDYYCEFNDQEQILSNVALVKAYYTGNQEFKPNPAPANFVPFEQVAQEKLDTIDELKVKLFGYPLKVIADTNPKQNDNYMVREALEDMVQEVLEGYAVNLNAHQLSAGMEGGPIMALENGLPKIIGLYAGMYDIENVQGLVTGGCFFSEEKITWLQDNK